MFGHLRSVIRLFQFSSPIILWWRISLEHGERIVNINPREILSAGFWGGNCSLGVNRKAAVLSVCGRSAVQKCGNDAIGPAGEVINPDHDNLYGYLGNDIIKAGDRPLRKWGGRVRFFLLTLFLAFPTSVIADRHETCIDVLNAPPLVDVLTRNDGHDFYKIDVRKSGFGLIGSPCTVEVLTEYFEAAGWEFVSVTRTGPSGPYGNPIKFYTDTHAKFCKKGRNLFTLYFRKCVQGAGVDFLKGHISFVNAGAIK